MRKIYRFLNEIIKIVLPKKTYIKLRSVFVLKKGQNLNNPQTYNEKTNYRKLYDKNPTYGIASNKYLVKEYAKNLLGYNISPETFWTGDRLTLEDIDNFPDKFVMKVTNGSGSKSYNLVKDKSLIDKNEFIKKFNKAVRQKYGKHSYEFWYDYSHQVIMVEELLEFNGVPPIEYKVYCFNNNDKFDAVIRVIKDRETNKTQSFYDLEWNYLPIGYMGGKLHDKLEKPNYFDDLIYISRNLSKEFDHVRVDLLYSNNKFYLGELTFADTSGFIKFDDNKWDVYLGEKWTQQIKK